jgi:trans-2,3-dihydro-3-hydroxyanthranilate isomerase
MSSLPFYWIDAFTDKKLGGNPCAVLLNTENLSAQTMQMIAKEMTISETSFIRRSKTADFGARYFTPQRELPFAGHPTIATVCALIEAGLLKDKTKVTLELPAGIIPIEISKKAELPEITMSQLSPKFLRTYDPQDIMAIYGLKRSDLIENVPIQTVSTGSPILMIPISNLNALQSLHYEDANRYTHLKAQGDFLYAHHFCLEGVTSTGQTFARGLGEPPDGLEDPFTGSSTGCMGAYLWKYSLIENPNFVAEQGHWMNRPGHAKVSVIGNRDAIETVRVSGQGVTIIRGHIEV